VDRCDVEWSRAFLTSPAQRDTRFSLLIVCAFPRRSSNPIARYHDGAASGYVSLFQPCVEYANSFLHGVRAN